MSGDALYHDVGYFHDVYEANDDPWGFEDRWYERRKYALTLAMLTQPRYRHAFEPGCANGALTALLQDRCDRISACELVPAVARRAGQRLAEHHHVDVRCGAFPDWWPVGGIDLLVLSEIAYYLTDEGLRRAERGIDSSLDVGGELVAVHYTGDTDYPMRGSDVATWLDGLPMLRPVARHRDESFEAGVWRRR